MVASGQQLAYGVVEGIAHAEDREPRHHGVPDRCSVRKRTKHGALRLGPGAEVDEYGDEDEHDVADQDADEAEQHGHYLPDVGGGLRGRGVVSV